MDFTDYTSIWGYRGCTRFVEEAFAAKNYFQDFCVTNQVTL